MTPKFKTGDKVRAADDFACPVHPGGSLTAKRGDVGTVRIFIGGWYFVNFNGSEGDDAAIPALESELEPAE